MKQGGKGARLKHVAAFRATHGPSRGTAPLSGSVAGIEDGFQFGIYPERNQPELLHAHEVAHHYIVGDAEFCPAMQEPGLGHLFDARDCLELGLQVARGAVGGVDPDVGSVGVFHEGNGGSTGQGNEAGDEDHQRHR